MLQEILTGQTKGIALLSMAFALFLYFLPSLLAFARAHRHFLPILVLNTLASVGMTVALISFGPAWLALLIWSLLSGEPDPRWLKARGTKAYDTVAALPLILWFTYGALQLRAVLAHDGAMIA